MVRKHPVKIVLTFDESSKLTSFVALLMAIDRRVGPKKKIAKKKKQSPTRKKTRLVYIPEDRCKSFIFDALSHIIPFHAINLLR